MKKYNKPKMRKHGQLKNITFSQENVQVDPDYSPGNNYNEGGGTDQDGSGW